MFSRRNFTDINFNVTEKRAPTDESVRLLREMEKEALNKIIKNLDRICVDAMKFSADNLAFGMGGNITQKIHRDSQQFAMKASAARINGEWIDVYKDPITDPNKKSMKGRFSVVLRDGKYVTQPYDETLGDEDLLKVRYKNGEVFDSPDFSTIRARAQSCLN